MPVKFGGWNIHIVGGLGYQYDHLSRELVVTGDLPEGWEWSMLVKVGDAMDILTLTPIEGGVGTTLTRDQLSIGNVYYALQLRGTRGEVVRHTNVVQVFIPRSISGDGQWPEVPSAFTALEHRLAELAAHPPIPGEKGYWKVWNPDTDTYEESEFPLPSGSGGFSGPVTPEDTTFYQQIESKNLLNLPDQTAALPGKTFQVEVDSNRFTFTKLTAATQNLNLRLDGSITVPESGTYTFTVHSNRTDLGGSIYVTLYRDTGSQVCYGFVSQTWTHVATATLEAGAVYYCSVNTNYSNLESLVSIGDPVEFWLQLEKGGVSTEWENPVLLEIPSVHQNKQEIEDLNNRIEGVYPMEPLAQFGGFAAAFRRIACIGDSLTAGILNNTDSSVSEVVAGTSYPEQMARLTGSTVYNLGYGGAVATHSAQAVSEYHSYQTIAEAKGWFDEAYRSQAYVIALGTNDIDYYGGFDGDVSTDIDDTDWSNNALTSVGGYAAILQRILAIQPEAKIFCVTIPKTRNTEALRVEANEKIKAIAKRFGGYVIDLYAYGPQEDEVNAWKVKYYTGYHLNALGYHLHARRILTYMDWHIRQSLREFGGIGLMEPLEETDPTVPHIGENGNWYLGGIDTGKPSRGEPGKDGYTPVKGEDYYTEADKQEFMTEVLASLPYAENTEF